MRTSKILVRVTVLVLCCLIAALIGTGKARQAKGKKYALLVGVTDYESNALAPLKYSANDAENLGKLLADKAKFDEVVVLTSVCGKKDKKFNPTAENIREQMKKLLANKKKDDLILIGLAGHGLLAQVADPKGKARVKEFALFCPSDANLAKADSLIDLHTDLFEPMGKCGAGLKVFLVDDAREERKLEGLKFKDGDQTIPEGVVGMFSCAKGQFAFETKQLEHGVFFYHVIKAIDGEAANKDGVVSWGRLSEYACENVEKYVKDNIGNGARQTPHSYSNVKGSPALFIIR